MFKNINNYRNKIILLSVMWALLLIAVFTWSVLTGQYPDFHAPLWALLEALAFQYLVMYIR